MPSWCPIREDYTGSRFWTKEFLDRCAQKWLDLQSPKQPSLEDYSNCFIEVFGRETFGLKEAYLFSGYKLYFERWFRALVAWLGFDEPYYVQIAEQSLFLKDETSQERIQLYDTLAKRLKREYDVVLQNSLKSRRWIEAEMYIDRNQGVAPPQENQDSVLHMALKYGAPKRIVERLLEYFHAQYGNESCEPISAFFATADPEIYCDLATLQLLLDRGALVARMNLRVSMKSFFAAFQKGRKEHVLLAFNHNYTREPNLICLPRDSNGTLWSWVRERANPRVTLEFLLLLLRFGAKPRDPVQSQKGMPDFFCYVEKLREEHVYVHESIVDGVKLACVLQVLCCARLPRFRRDSAPIGLLPTENIQLLKSFLEVTFDLD